MILKRNIIVGIGLVALGAITAGGAFAGDLEIVTVVADGKGIASAVLIVDGTPIAITDGNLRSIKGLPDKRIAVTVDAQVASGKSTVRYLGVTEVKTLPGQTLPVTVTIRPVADIDAFCTGCHPSRGDAAVKPNQIFRDIHVSGKELTGKYLLQVKMHNDRVAELVKNKSPNPPLPIPLEERAVKVGGKEVKKFFYTCESCHTTHLKTLWTKSARASFTRPSTLCVGCHY